MLYPCDLFVQPLAFRAPFLLQQMFQVLACLNGQFIVVAGISRTSQELYESRQGFSKFDHGGLVENGESVCPVWVW